MPAPNSRKRHFKNQKICFSYVPAKATTINKSTSANKESIKASKNLHSTQIKQLPTHPLYDKFFNDSKFRNKKKNTN